jgi:hypothetical protein
VIDETLSLDHIVIRETFSRAGGAEVLHTLRLPSESERRQFRSKATQTRYVRGAKKLRTSIVSNLRVFAQLYDTLIMHIEGATVDGEVFTPANRSRFIAAIDPLFKRSVVQAMINALEAQLQD